MNARSPGVTVNPFPTTLLTPAFAVVRAMPSPATTASTTTDARAMLTRVRACRRPGVEPRMVPTVRRLMLALLDWRTGACRFTTMASSGGHEVAHDRRVIQLSRPSNLGVPVAANYVFLRKAAPPPGGGAAPQVLSTLTTAWVDQPRATPESKPSANTVPVVHVFGRFVSPVPEPVSEFPAPTAARSRNRTVPVGASTAIQYVWPTVTATGVETATLLFAFTTGAAIVPLVNSVPGWPATLLYRPIFRFVPVEVESMKMRSCWTVPAVATVVLNASARPAAFESTRVSVAALPSRTASPAGGGGGVDVTVPAA